MPLSLRRATGKPHRSPLAYVFARKPLEQALDLGRCSDCASTQSRIICCSVRNCLTRPWIASARLAIAVVAAGSIRYRRSPPEAIDGELDLARHGSGRRPAMLVGIDAEIAHRGGEPVLELGIETVLRLVICRSRNPSTSDPASPNSEDENRSPCR